MHTENHGHHQKDRWIIYYSFFWSFMLLFFVPIASVISGESFSQIPYDLSRILTSPCRLVTDYFELGGAGASFLNAGLCGLSCSLIMVLINAKPTVSLLAGYFLVIAHCFYGLNFLNMWIPFLSIPLYCLIKKENYRRLLHISFFCTSLGPFISDFLFRYTIIDSFSPYYSQFSFQGLLIALIFGMGSGFIVPALLPGTTGMHRGFNLYKAGLAIGLYGIFSFALFYKTMGIMAPYVINRYNRTYEINGRSYFLLALSFFGTVFLLTFLLGFILNGKSIKGYFHLISSDGLKDDFNSLYGMPLTLINIGIYGLCVFIYFSLIIFLFDGDGFTGPTFGVTIAAITFSAAGQTPKNVWPIALGYMLMIGSVSYLCHLFGLNIPSVLSYQGYINGMAFATGLCPFAGNYGIGIGVLAGMINAVICTSTSQMHGGLVLYNGGLAAGLTAILLLPILDFYKVKTKFEK